MKTSNSLKVLSLFFYSNIQDQLLMKFVSFCHSLSIYKKKKSGYVCI
jgi:hypothetical protein